MQEAPEVVSNAVLLAVGGGEKKKKEIMLFSLLLYCNNNVTHQPGFDRIVFFNEVILYVVEI